MKKLHFLFICVLLHTIVSLIALNTYAQTPNWEWINNGGTTSSGSNDDYWESCRTVCTDDNGNIYGISNLTSSFTQIDTVTKPQGFGYTDFCVFSYRADGSFRWVSFIGYPLNDKIGDITVDEEGNVYVTGGSGVTYFGDCHIGDSIIPLSTTTLKGEFIAKLDSTGHTEWVKFPGPVSIAGFPSYFFRQIELDNQNNPNVYVRFQGSCTFEGYAIPDSGQYMFKFDKYTGDLLNVTKLDIKQLSGGIGGYFFTMDTDNNTYMMCVVDKTIVLDGDTVTSDFPLVNRLLIRFDTLGQVVWYKEIGGMSNTNTYCSIWGKPAVNEGYVYVCGETQSYPGSNFLGVPINNPMANSTSRRTRLFARFNKQSGDFVSVINLHNQDHVYTAEIAIRGDKIVASGVGGDVVLMNQTDTIQPAPPGPFDNYIFIVEMDTALTQFNWGINAVADGVPRVESLTCDTSGNIYVGGMMEGSVYNSNGIATSSMGGKDFFIAKVTGHASVVLPDSVIAINVENCDNYVSPSGNYSWNTTGFFLDTLTSSTNTDSILEINLTINYSADTMIYISSCGSYMYNGELLSISEFYTDSLFSQFGCDSIVTLDLNVITVDTAVTSDGFVLNANFSGADYQWINCDNGNAPVAGATNQSFAPNVNGHYALVISYQGCSDTSSCYAINPIGIGNELEQKAYTIYPNPVSKQLTINFNTANLSGRAEIVNMQGSVLNNYQFNNASQYQINTEHLTAGKYILRITTENQSPVHIMFEKRN